MQLYQDENPKPLTRKKLQIFGYYCLEETVFFTYVVVFP